MSEEKKELEAVVKKLKSKILKDEQAKFKSQKVIIYFSDRFNACSIINQDLVNEKL